MYISPQKAFAHIGRLADWQRGHTPAPVTVEVDLSNVCSLGCQSCHMAYTHVAGPRTGSEAPDGFAGTGRFADLNLFSRAFGDMMRVGVKGVVFSGGGEPTLHPQFEAFVEAAHFTSLQMGLYTLGGHLSDVRSALVREKMTWVVVSLDAADAETYAFEKRVPASRFADACEGVRRLSGGSATIGVSFLLHNGNWQNTAAMLELGRQLGAHYVTFRPAIETDPHDLSVIAGARAWVTEALPRLQALAEKPGVEVSPDRFIEFRDWTGRSYSTCYGIRLVTQITPDGRVWICPNRRGIAGSELGDLNKESFSDIWARHPGQWTDFTGCRAMCRLNAINSTLADVYAKRPHEAFV